MAHTSRPEALHIIEVLALGAQLPHILQRRVRDVRPGGVVDGLEHLPRHILQLHVARDPVQNEEWLDGFGSEEEAGIHIILFVI